MGLVLLCCPPVLLAGLKGHPKLGALFGEFPFPLYQARLPMLQLGATSHLPSIADLCLVLTAALTLKGAFETKFKRAQAKAVVGGTPAIVLDGAS